MRTSGAAAALLGATGGAAVGAGLERLLAESKVAWATLLGGPDASATLMIDRPFSNDVVSADLELVIETPEGTFVQSQGRVTLTGGVNQLELTLSYPFDDFVHGRYAYHAKLSVDGEAIATAAPIRYDVEPFLWFS